MRKINRKQLRRLINEIQQSEFGLPHKFDSQTMYDSFKQIIDSGVLNNDEGWAMSQGMETMMTNRIQAEPDANLRQKLKDLRNEMLRSRGKVGRSAGDYPGMTSYEISQQKRDYHKKEAESSDFLEEGSTKLSRRRLRKLILQETQLLLRSS